MLLIFDTETTGLGLQDRPIQLAALLAHPVSLEIVDKFQTLIDPEMPIDEGAYAVHGISNDDVKGKPTLSQVYRDLRFNSMLRRATVAVAHNINFDLRMMGEQYFSHLKKLDTVVLAGRVYPESKSRKLQHLVKALNLPERQAHDAMGDVLSVLDFLKSVQAKTGWDGYRMQLEAVNLKKHYQKLLSI